MCCLTEGQFRPLAQSACHRLELILRGFRVLGTVFEVFDPQPCMSKTIYYNLTGATGYNQVLELEIDADVIGSTTAGQIRIIN